MLNDSSIFVLGIKNRSSIEETKSFFHPTNFGEYSKLSDFTPSSDGKTGFLIINEGDIG